MGAILLLTQKLKDFVLNNNLEIDDDRIEDEASPYYTSPLIRWSGQPGMGKTFDMSRVGFYGGYRYRLPTFVQDSKGDIAIYHGRMVASLANRKDNESKKKLDYLRNKVKISHRSDGVDMINLVDYLSDKMAGRPQKFPTVNFIVDEGGALQFDNKKDFWNIASTFRNIGVNCHVSTHREGGDGGIGPLGREATRAVVVYPQYAISEFFGKKVERTCVPLSTSKVYIDSIDKEFKTFELANGDEPIKKNTIPAVLIHPVNATRVDKMLI